MLEEDRFYPNVGGQLTSIIYLFLFISLFAGFPIFFILILLINVVHFLFSSKLIQLVNSVMY